jgi:hypothetical protein
LGGLGVEGLPEPEPLAPRLTDPNIDQLLLQLGDSQNTFLVWLNRAAVLLFVLLALLVLYFAVRRYIFQRSVTFGVEETGRPALATTGERSGLGRRILDRFGRWRRWRAAATVRHLYHAMCIEAAERGFPRAPSETPFEYLATLDEAWPVAGGEVRLITGAYVRVRYGEVPESAEELEEIRGAWRRLMHSPEAV